MAKSPLSSLVRKLERYHALDAAERQGDRRRSARWPARGTPDLPREPAKCLLGDKAYDSNELRADLDEQGTKPVIPNRSNRKQRFSFSKRLYKLRWRIEAAFNRLKDFRRIATRYDRLARNYLASVCLAAALVWWI